jgi:hypothetical protein
MSKRTAAAAAEAPILWVPKKEAAELLGCSVRWLERIAARGHLRVETHARARGRGRMAVYAKADLDAWLAGEPNSHAVEVAPAPAAGSNAADTVALAPNGAGKSAPGMGPGVAQGVALALGAIAAQKPAAAPPVKPWLTLREAAEYSGLPVTYLVRQAKNGADFVRNVGTEAGPRYRFNRDALAR